MNKRLNQKFMKIFLYTLLIFSASATFISSKDKETIIFKAEDGLEITADLYIKHELTKPFIVLFHQAGWSRGEYLEIAPRLNNMGFNCMAVDQRAGNFVNDLPNETYKRAVEQGKATDYISAYTDMKAALKFVKEKYAEGKLIIWGSSYSSSLVLKLASDFPEPVDGVLAFSPGEYFTDLGKSETFVTEAAQKIKCPVFITSAKDEKVNWEKIYEAIPGNSKSFFLPVDAGNHGSRALWMKFFDSGNYWLAAKKFLSQFLLENQKGKNNAGDNK